MDLYIIQAEDSRLGPILGRAEGQRNVLSALQCKRKQDSEFFFFFSNLTLNNI